MVVGYSIDEPFISNNRALMVASSAGRTGRSVSRSSSCASLMPRAPRISTSVLASYEEHVQALTVMLGTAAAQLGRELNLFDFAAARRTLQAAQTSSIQQQ